MLAWQLALDCALVVQADGLFLVVVESELMELSALCRCENLPTCVETWYLVEVFNIQPVWPLTS